MKTWNKLFKFVLIKNEKPSSTLLCIGIVYNSFPWWNLIIQMKGVLRRTVGGGWFFNILCRSHLHSQVWISYCHLTLKMTSAQHIETSVTTKSPWQYFFPPDDQILSKCRTPRFQPSFIINSFVVFFTNWMVFVSCNHHLLSWMSLLTGLS